MEERIAIRIIFALLCGSQPIGMNPAEIQVRSRLVQVGAREYGRLAVTNPRNLRSNALQCGALTYIGRASNSPGAHSDRADRTQSSQRNEEMNCEAGPHRL